MKKILFFLGFLHILSGAGAQRISDIVIRCDTSAGINYGTTINFYFYFINKKGKEKRMSDNDVRDQIVVDATGGTYDPNARALTLMTKPITKNYDGAKIKFSYRNKDQVIEKNMNFRLNFSSPVKLNFAGDKGINGYNGTNGGQPLLLLRDGKAGDHGTAGGKGNDGGDITVKIKKEFDERFKKEIPFCYVTDNKINVEYIFRIPFPEKGIIISVSGGDGGDGGKGGEGGDGKNGVVQDGKTKYPGDGGNGGDGGNAGDGGNGGKVKVILHSNSMDVISYLQIFNQGGLSGSVGAAGKGGDGGKAASGQSAGRRGNNGIAGLPGKSGEPGPAYELRSEDF